jgi:menaquinone-dependent protoporphyrinogen oxidase
MIQIFAVTHDGQAERIARRIADHLRSSGFAHSPEQLQPFQGERMDEGNASEQKLALSAEVISLNETTAILKINPDAEVVVLVAAVRYGKHLPATDAFLTRYARIAAAPPLALASVNLVARKPGRQSAETNPYLRKLIARHHLQPAVAAAFAGRLCYPQYNWRDRQIIRLIMLLTGGVADGRSTVEYTDLHQVHDFAASVAALARESQNRPPD